MSERPRSVLVCPGIGSYGASSLGSLPGDHPAVQAAEGIRLEYGLESLVDLDRAEQIDPARHLRPANAAALTFVATLLDAERAMADHRLVAVIGSSMGWFSAIAVAAALPFEDAFRVVQEVALLRERAASGPGSGGQVIYPLSGPDWRRSADLEAAVLDVLADDGAGERQVFESIDLGGFVVLAGDRAGVARLLARLPAVKAGTRRFPLRLALQGPDHTPLAEEVAEQAADRLTGLHWQAPATTLIDGRGTRWTPWSTDAAGLRHYTLGAQLTEPFRFTTSLHVALREYAPELVVLAGPGATLGSIVGGIVVGEGYRGLRSRAAFEAAQHSSRPLVLSMGRGA
ncbi:MAG TPA: ACP S-malonyltransferase [Candidatus Limnocylindria bacterium]